MAWLHQPPSVIPLLYCWHHEVISLWPCCCVCLLIYVHDCEFHIYLGFACWLWHVLQFTSSFHSLSKHSLYHMPYLCCPHLDLKTLVSLTRLPACVDVALDFRQIPEDGDKDEILYMYTPSWCILFSYILIYFFHANPVQYSFDRFTSTSVCGGDGHCWQDHGYSLCMLYGHWSVVSLEFGTTSITGGTFCVGQCLVLLVPLLRWEQSSQF